MNARDHLSETRSRLSASSIVSEITVVTEIEYQFSGYFRARLRLTNNDAVELAEYFFIEGSRFNVRRYRYQWMNGSEKVLRKRWDNACHYPDLPGFPDHVHEGPEDSVRPGIALSIVDLLDLLEQEFAKMA
jgi:hypothetical protein